MFLLVFTFLLFNFIKFFMLLINAENLLWSVWVCCTYQSWRERWPSGWQTPLSPLWASCICGRVAGWRRRGRAGPSASSAPHPWCSPQRTPARPHTAASGTRCWGWGSPSRHSAVGSSGLPGKGWKSLQGQKWKVDENRTNSLSVVWMFLFLLFCFYLQIL